MPVPLQTPINTYTGNAVATVFAYQWLLLRAGDLRVTVGGSTKALVTDYTVSGLGSTDGGNVTFLSPPADGVEIVMQRAIPLLRETDYQEGGDLPASTLDADFDRIWMVLQGMIAGVGFNGYRFALFPDSYFGSVVLPEPEPLQIWGWNASGDAVVNFELDENVLIEPSIVPHYLFQQYGIR